MTAGGRIRADGIRATESLYGAHRAERPSDFHGNPIECPFCPGNEARTGALMTADPGSEWETRVVANIYPAVVEPDGRHEVIVETRAHAVRWTSLECGSIERILRVYAQREAAGYADGYAYVALFKNSGPAAGASLEHPHAQVIALRAIPLSIAARLERLGSDCPVCRTVRLGAARIVARDAHTVAYVPDGARTAFEVRVAPLAHAARFSHSDPLAFGALAAAIDAVMKRLAAVLGEGLPFNMIVQSAPRDPRAETLMHWEIEIVPRTENFGGYEVGTGGFLVSRTPEEAAAILRAATGAVYA